MEHSKKSHSERSGAPGGLGHLCYETFSSVVYQMISKYYNSNTFLMNTSQTIIDEHLEASRYVNKRNLVLITSRTFQSKSLGESENYKNKRQILRLIERLKSIIKQNLEIKQNEFFFGLQKNIFS